MEKSHTYSVAEIRELGTRLHYTRFDAHVKCSAVEETITLLYKILEIREDNIEYKTIYLKLGIYFAFYKRNKEMAAKFFEKYLSFCNPGLEMAEALSLLGYAYVIDPTYKSEKIFSEALSHIPEVSQDVSAILIKAFALQYLALMLHRQARRDKSREIDSALIRIKTAIDLQQGLLETFPYAKIAVAESLLLNAMMLSRLGEVHLNQEYFKQANELLINAMKLGNEFCAETKSTHFLTAIIQQSHAMVLMHLNQHDHALVILKNALQEQYAMFNSQTESDIAKSLHLIGDAYSKQQDHVSSINAYLQALMCKMQIDYNDDSMIKTTQDPLLVELSHITRENTQLAFTIRNKIYQALTGETPSFLNKCEDFTYLIEVEMNELRDEISLKHLNSYSVMFKAGRVNMERHENELEVMRVKHPGG